MLSLPFEIRCLAAFRAEVATAIGRILIEEIARGIAQERLAEAAGIELRAMQAIEVGRQSMSLATLVRLANALHVSPGVLLRSAAMPEIKRGRPRKRPAGT
ncbi:helix-turn-helix transcriptional regulator [Sorangium sp. So ce260]